MADFHQPRTYLFTYPMYEYDFAMIFPSPFLLPCLMGVGGGGFGEVFGGPVFAVPKNVEFKVRTYTPSGGFSSEKTLSRTGPDDEDFPEIRISADEDEGDMTVQETVPKKGAGNVPVNTKIAVTFSKQIVMDAVREDNFRLKELTDGNRKLNVGWKKDGSGKVIYEKLEAAGAVRGFVCIPARRLKYDTKYVIEIKDIKGWGNQTVTVPDITFTTFDPRVVGSVSVHSPNDISVLNDERIAVASGRTGDSGAGTHGVVLLNVADPASPKILDEEAVAGDTLGVFATPDTGVPGIEGQPVVLAVSGGMNHDSTLSVLKVTGDELNDLTPAGSAIISRKRGTDCSENNDDDSGHDDDNGDRSLHLCLHTGSGESKDMEKRRGCHTEKSLSE